MDIGRSTFWRGVQPLAGWGQGKRWGSLAQVLLCLLQLSLSLLFFCGCQTLQPSNPSFALSLGEARRELKLMADDPRPLARPLVILDGWLDPGFSAWAIRRELTRVLQPGEPVLAVSFASAYNFDQCRCWTIEAVEKAFPSADETATVEVDVVAFSMGGLVARYAALEQPGKKQLRIARLWTIATPHRGAVGAECPLAIFPNWYRLPADMRAQSSFLQQLHAAKIDYAIYPYVRCNDHMIGAVNAAPASESPWWVPQPRWLLPHALAPMDSRIIADIARRLRGERPYTSSLRHPLPNSCAK